MTIRKRPLPIRSCIACGRKAHKKELIRIVKNSRDTVIMDLTGKLDGRGTYVCKDSPCVSAKLNQARVEHALRIKFGKDKWTTFALSLESLSTSY